MWATVLTAAAMRRGRSVIVWTMFTGRVTNEKAAAKRRTGGDFRLEPLAASSAGVAARAPAAAPTSVFTSSDSGAITATNPCSRTTPNGSGSGSATSPAGFVAGLAGGDGHRCLAQQLLGEVDGQRLARLGRRHLEPFHRVRPHVIHLQTGWQADRQVKRRRTATPCDGTRRGWSVALCRAESWLDCPP